VSATTFLPRHAAAALLLAFGALAGAPASAEKADRDKEADVVADHSTLDDLHQVDVLTGHVLLTKGTMRLAGEYMEHRQDERGYQYYIVTAAPGELATFHERRDPVLPGVESTVDGVGERIEYDDRSDQVVLLRRAVVKRFDNGEQREVLSGERIVYDGRKASYDVEGKGADGNGRVHLVIPPRNNPETGVAAPGATPRAPLQSERALPEGGK
jgi:lipopolysaccharide export system protein LptA